MRVRSFSISRLTHAVVALWLCGAGAAWAGDGAAVTRYQSWCEATYREYLGLRLHVYGRVSRWPASQFWQRRRQ